AGFTRARVDGEVILLENKIELDRYKQHDIEAVGGRIVLRDCDDDTERDHFLSRLTDSVETALNFGNGYLTVQNLSVEPNEDISYSEHLVCPEHGISIPEIEPRTFSFNTPHGMCQECQGIGTKLEI